jgi:Mn2+/Fe2+ NRAMP family transporter
LLFVLRLVNNRHLMGRYTNGVAFNAIAWATTGVLILLRALLIGGALGIGPATA